MSQTQETIISQHEGTHPVVWDESLPKLLELGISPDEATRAEQVSAITGDGLIKLSTDIHTLVAPDVEHIPPEDVMHIQSPDGSNRKELMLPSERATLMNHAAELVQSLAAHRTTSGDNKAFLKRAANVVSLSVVLAHTFPDGNGRTARTAGQFIRDGLDETKAESIDDMKMVSANRPESGFRIFSYLPTKRGLELTPVELLDTAAALDVPLQDETVYLNLKNDAFTTPYPG